MRWKVSLRIQYNRRSHVVILLAVVLLTVGFLGCLVLRPREAAASGPQTPLAPCASQRASQASSSGLRQYYVTTAYHLGGDAKNACAAGYHMASLWEILDTSNLRYNSALGVTQDDSGSGPPSYYAAWVRTGYGNSTTGSAGQANCDGWSSSSGSDNGTFVYLPGDWAAPHTIHVWEADVVACSAPLLSVWCVADTVGAGTCVDPLHIDCDQQASGDTTSYVNNISGYDCSAWDESGPETIYAFTLETGDFYTVTAMLGSLGGMDLDVFLLSSAGCSGGQCLMEGSFDNLEATAGPLPPGTYYIAVDGFNGDAGSYTLDLTCTPGAGEKVYLPLVLRNY